MYGRPLPPEHEIALQNVQEPAATGKRSGFVAFWSLVMVSTIAAGGLFGLVAGSLPGMFVGPIFAGVFGIPIVSTIAVLTWALWLTRYSPVSAGLAGAITGVTSTAITWDSVFDLEYVPSIWLAGLIGGIVAGLFPTLYWNKYTKPRLETQNDSLRAWQYSLRDLFVRFTVVTTLIAAWTILITQLMKVKS